MILIDTSVLIDFLRGRMDLPEDICFTTITFYELFWKATEKNATKELKIIKEIFALFPVFSFDLKAAEQASIIKAKLQKAGLDVSPFDVLIAGIATANGIEEIWTKDSDFKEIEKFVDIKVKIFEL